MKGFRLTDVYDWNNKKPNVRAWMKRKLNKRFRKAGKLALR